MTLLVTSSPACCMVTCGAATLREWRASRPFLIQPRTMVCVCVWVGALWRVTGWLLRFASCILQLLLLLGLLRCVSLLPLVSLRTVQVTAKLSLACPGVQVGWRCVFLLGCQPTCQLHVEHEPEGLCELASKVHIVPSAHATAASLAMCWPTLA